jgi:hypothetical protein
VIEWSFEKKRGIRKAAKKGVIYSC